jgi:polyhydroxyalkanoate synthesis repressor PhaR
MARDKEQSGSAAKRVIKRYPNRKLYDSEERAFTSLRGLERMIRRGIDVQVIDNATGDDITEDTLAQVLRGVRRGDVDVLSAMIRTPGKIARTIAGEEDHAAEIRELRETVRRLSETIDKLVADKDGDTSKSEAETTPGVKAEGG